MSTPTKPKIYFDLPIIAELGKGYFLVAHQNGPAIATDSSIATLDSAFPDDEDEDDIFAIPHDVGIEAIRAFVRWAWPQLKPPKS